MNSEEQKLKFLDISSTVIIVLTLILFALAVYLKGFGHELLLEAAVFLISVKLIHANYKNNITTTRLERKLEEISAQLRK